MNEFMEELQRLAQDYKEQQQKYIDKIAETDLAFIESMGGKVPASELPRLKTNLDYISDRYHEMRIINYFVDFCDATRSLESTLSEPETGSPSSEVGGNRCNSEKLPRQDTPHSLSTKARNKQ